MSALSNFDEWRALPVWVNEKAGWGAGRFKEVASWSPEGNFYHCTLCGAVVTSAKAPPVDSQAAMERHTLWHASMLAPQHQDRQQRRLEDARADTIALRDELADTPSGSNPRNCRT